MKEIKEQLKEDKSLSFSKQIISSTRKLEPAGYGNISKRKLKNDKEEKKYQEKIVKQLETLIRGDNSIFTIYD